jgi:hypothetical protein
MMRGLSTSRARHMSSLGPLFRAPVKPQLAGQFGNIHRAFVVHSPAAAHSGQCSGSSPIELTAMRPATRIKRRMGSVPSLTELAV